MEKHMALLVELKKLTEILNTFGNVLVPAIEGVEETFAFDKFKYVQKQLNEDFGMTDDEISEMVENL